MTDAIPTPPTELPKPRHPTRKHGQRRSYWRKMQIAKMYCIGKKDVEIAEALGYKHPGSVRNLIYTDEETKALIYEIRTATKEQFLEDLDFAQRVAFREMVDLATNAKNEKVRFDAQQHLMNMGGKPGKPTDVSESRSMALTGDAAAAIIANSLRDPGVRALLEQNPQLKALLRGPAAESDSSSGSPEPPPSDGSERPE